jgi:hypothetical protein
MDEWMDGWVMVDERIDHGEGARDRSNDKYIQHQQKKYA